jgi:hypothetical protein
MPFRTWFVLSSGAEKKGRLLSCCKKMNRYPHNNKATYIFNDALVVSPAAGTLMQVQIPAGVFAGQSMLIQAPDGTQFNVQVPPGAPPGSSIQVQVPGSAPSKNPLNRGNRTYRDHLT